MKKKIIFHAEWYPQSVVQMTWPHEDTDWLPILDEVTECFITIAKEIAKREKLLIVCKNEAKTRAQLTGINFNSVIFREIISNDTWARDHGGITVFIDEKPVIYDFVFNGWGMQFAAGFDNLITRRLVHEKTFAPAVDVVSMQPFILEGGSIDTDGKGTLLTTVSCLCSLNRNEHIKKEQIEAYLKDIFGLSRVLWLENGKLEGDDTGGHIDTLARFCDENTIAYVKCTDKDNSCYKSLKEMEKELKSFRALNGQPYRLIPLPMVYYADWEYEWQCERLPATYANFLIINGAVLVPFYQLETDAVAAKALQKAFPDREVIGIDCRPLVKQNGSLHCVTMQYPQGVVASV